MSLNETVARILSGAVDTHLHAAPDPYIERRLDVIDVARQAAEAVALGEADEGIVMCWTGTGAALAANKIPGIRAALCHDAETARGARIWNHANVLALSLRATAEAILKEILDAWFSTPYSQDEWNQRQIARIRALEEQYSRTTVGPSAPAGR